MKTKKLIGAFFLGGSLLPAGAITIGLDATISETASVSQDFTTWSSTATSDFYYTVGGRINSITVMPHFQVSSDGVNWQPVTTGNFNISAFFIPNVASPPEYFYGYDGVQMTLGNFEDNPSNPSNSIDLGFSSDWGSNPLDLNTDMGAAIYSYENSASGSGHISDWPVNTFRATLDVVSLDYTPVPDSASTLGLLGGTFCLLILACRVMRHQTC